MTSSYHPQANGMVERLHRQIKESLRARGCGTAWAEHILWVMLGLRAAPKDKSGLSAAKLVFGEELVLPGQAAADAGGSRPQAPPSGPPAGDIPLRARSYAEAAKGPLDSLARASYVYVQRGNVAAPTQPPYEGPFQVLERRQKTFLTQLGDRSEAISIDWLKPHVGAPPEAAAAPPRRGRPPGTGGNVDSSSSSSGGGQCSGKSV
jgi:hypothetical protein